MHIMKKLIIDSKTKVNMTKYILLILVVMLFSFCSKIGNNTTEEPLAQVGNIRLYPSDLKGLLKPGMQKKDSAIIVASLVEKWVRKQLILQKAEMNLTDQEKDVNLELDEYRTSLIIFRYEQKLVKEKLDTAVNPSEVDEYYKQNPSNFILNYDIVKAQFLKLNLQAPNIDKVKEWLRTENEENIKNIETYSIQYASKYEYFRDDWVNFDNIRMIFPGELPQNELQLRTTKVFEAKDSTSYYLLCIRDMQSKGQVAPYSYVDKDIRSILLLKRKQKLINDFENRIYFDALDKNNFKIFKN